MTAGLSAAIDRRLEQLIVARARRRWPALGLVPVRWLRPAVAPAARRLRHVLTLATAITVGLALLAIW